MTDVSKILNGLQPSATYTVQVRSKNSDGEYSDWSNSYTFSTPSNNINTTNTVVVQNLSGGYIYAGDSAMGTSSDPLVSLPTSPYLVLSSRGIQGGSGSNQSFFLPTDGTNPTIGAFGIIKTDLVLPSSFITSPVPLTLNPYFFLPLSYSSSITYGMYVTGTGIPANTTVRGVYPNYYNPTSKITYTGSVLVRISANITATSTSPVTFRAPDAKIRVGSSASNSITIQGPNAGGILDTPASIYTTINNVQTSSNSGAGFYLDETGKFRFASSSTAYVSGDGSGNLIVSGCVVATAGNIGGLNLASDKLSSSGPGTFVGISGSGTYAFWAGSANPAQAPFYVTNTGSVYAQNLSLTNSLLVGGSSGSISGINPTNSNGRAIFSGAASNDGTGANFWVTNTGSVYSTGGASFQGPIFSSGSLTGTSLGGTSTNSGSLVGGAILVPNAASPTFNVDSLGNMTASNAYLSGSIVSNSGSIGGWQINVGSLTSGTGASAVGISTGNYSFYAGNTTPSSAPFSVTNTGILTASGANISGSLTATTGSIGGFTITGSALYGGTSGSITGFNPYNASATIFAGATSSAGDNAKFYVTNSGSLYSTGGASFAGPVMSAASLSAPVISGSTTNSGSIIGGSIFVPNTTTPAFKVDSSGNLIATSASITGTISSSAGNIGGIYLNSDSISAASSSNYATQILNTGPQVFLQFETNPPIDSSSNNYPTTWGGTPTSAYFTSGFNGTGRTIASPSATVLNTQIPNANYAGASANISIELWITGNVTPTVYAGLAAKTLTASTVGNGGWLLQAIPSSNNIFVRVDTDLAGYPSGQSLPQVGPVFNDNKWHHVVYLIGQGTASGYYDGSYSGSGTWNSGPNGISSSANLYVSNQTNTGYKDQFAVYHRLLSSAEILANYNAGIAARGFSIYNNGQVNINNANVAGNINATSGSIGSWSITSGNLVSGTGASAVGLTTGNYAIYAGNSTPASAPFSVTNTGNLYAQNAVISGSINASSGTFSGLLSATTGSIGGFTISSSSLTATNISLTSSNGIALGTLSSPAFTVNTSGQLVATSASITGQISASSGNIAGWTLTNQEIGTGSGATRVALNSASPKIYIGYGNYGTGDTGFYVDSSGYFSLGNQLTFAPGKGTASIVTTPTTFVNGSASVTTTYNNSSSVIIPGTLVTASALPTGVRVASVSFGANATASLTYTSSFSGTINTTFQSDNLSLLTVNGTIRGAIDSVNPISSPTLFTSITSASINTTASAVVFTASAGHFFSPSSVLIFTGLPSTNGLNLLNYAASSGNAYSITSTPNSTQFTISSASLALTTGNVTASGRASIQQLTMGLHPAMNTGTSYANNTGTGIRLDDYNWWLVNNQFRVGNALSYFKYDGTQFRIAGGGTYNLIMQVGAADSANQFAITSGSTGTHNNTNTPFYVDGSGKMSLGTGLVWTGSALSIIGSASISGSVVASTGSIGGWNISTSSISSGSINLVSNPTPKIYIGTGTYNNSNTPFYVDNSGSFSLGNQLTWNGSSLSIIGSASISGSVIANSGSVGGWNIGTSSISSGSINLVSSPTPRIYIGAGSYSNSNTPFYVDNSGSLSLGNKLIWDTNNLSIIGSASISGSVVATSGYIGSSTNGWIINSSSISSSDASTFFRSTVSGDPASTIVLQMGASSLFSVTKGGTVTASNANIYGTINGLTIGFGNAGKGINPTNIALGISALYTNISGSNNFAMGSSALYSNTIGQTNFAAGLNSLLLNQNGADNVAIGQNTLVSNLSGGSNIAIGPSALYSGSNNFNNIAIGVSSLQSNNIGIENIAIGKQSLQSNNTGNNNISLGSLSLNKNSTGNYNVAIGVQSMQNNTTGYNNIGIGYSALNQNVSGTQNVAVGLSALNNNVAGGSNVAIGVSALTYNVAGNQNVAIGLQSMQYNASGNYNIGIGFNTLYQNANGNNNIALGYSAMNGAGTSTNPQNNISIGSYSASGITTGYNNVILGNSSASSISIGYNNIVLGNSAAISLTTGNDNIAIGNNALNSNSVGINNIAIGNNSGANLVGLSAGGTGNYNSFNTILGYSALRYAASADYSVAIGASALGGAGLIYSAQNVAVGALALSSASGNQIVANTAVGQLALQVAKIPQGQTAIGYGALSLFGGASTAYYGNTALGSFAAATTFASGAYNTFIGCGTDSSTASVNGTVAIGVDSGGNSAKSTQNNQIVIGTSGHAASATQIAGNTVNVGAWVPYTASITNVTVNYGTGGSIQGSYAQIGKTIFFKILMNFGTGVSFSTSTNWLISLPVNAVYGTYDHYGGIGTYGGQQAAVIYAGLAVFASSNSINLTYPGATAGTVAFVNSITPRTFAAGDWVRITGTYEAA